MLFVLQIKSEAEDEPMEDEDAKSGIRLLRRQEEESSPLG